MTQELDRNKREEGDRQGRYQTRKGEKRNTGNRGNQGQGIAKWAEKEGKQN